MPASRNVVPDLRAFIARAKDDNAVLERNGAVGEATARRRLLAELEDVLASEAPRTYSVAEAVAISGASHETVRRCVRSGTITDLRSNARGRMRISEEGIALLKGKARRRTNRIPQEPGADAVALLARLKGVGQ